MQESHFRLPEDPTVPVIMCGPGTGIAPFRAFLQHRAAQGLKGRTWLFFGDQRRATDFLFADEIDGWQRGRHPGAPLARLVAATARRRSTCRTACARRRPTSGAGSRTAARFYICGDASRMAKDVDTALREIAMKQGGMNADAARDWIVALARQGRYQRDVY